jgi:hypothetical protein
MGEEELRDLAGMTNPRGRLGNPIPPGSVWVPGVIRLDPANGALSWEGLGGKPVKPPEDLIQFFAELFRAQPAGLIDFAKRYGVLGLSEDAQIPWEPNFVRGIEPVEKWRSLASEVRSILHLAAMLHAGENVHPEDIAGDPPTCPIHNIKMLAALRLPTVSYMCPRPDCSESRPFQACYGPISERAAIEFQIIPAGVDPNTRNCFWSNNAGVMVPFPVDKKKRSKIAQQWLDMTLDDWLFRFPSTISVERSSGELELRLDYRFGLLSVIAMQLMQAVARRAIYFCSACKEPFVRHGGSNMERRPKAGMDRFCDNCGRPAAVLRADERRRHKIAEAQRLFRRGVSLREIAERLKVRGSAKSTPVETVRGWITKRKGK